MLMKRVMLHNKAVMLHFSFVCSILGPNYCTIGIDVLWKRANFSGRDAN